jgi:hypothetical protein
MARFNSSGFSALAAFVDRAKRKWLSEHISLSGKACTPMKIVATSGIGAGCKCVCSFHLHCYLYCQERLLNAIMTA